MGEPFQDQVERYFDALGEREWSRFDDLEEQIALHIYQRFLARFAGSGMRCLDAGAGPGRFTIQLIQAGATVVVGDLSQVQLDLNAARLADAGLEAGVEDRVKIDICDLSHFPADSFDLVLAYGGPVSYAFDRAGDAVRELARVAKPGAPVVGSVMSLAGSARHYLASFGPTIDAVGLEEFDRFLGHGDQRTILAAGAHPCRLFTWRDLETLLTDAGLNVVASSASQWLSLGDHATARTMMDDEATRARFLAWEERLCAHPGAVEGGKHILFAARKPG